MRFRLDEPGAGRILALALMLALAGFATPALGTGPVEKTEPQVQGTEFPDGSVDDQMTDPVESTTTPHQFVDDSKKEGIEIVESERVLSSRDEARILVASTGPIRDVSSFTLWELAPNDDGSSSEISLPFPVTIRSSPYQSLYVNNNGNVTFDGPMYQYTPQPFGLLGRPMFAPFWADVDTRGTGSVRFGFGVIDGRSAFVVNWNGVGYYPGATDKTATFQLVITSRSDRGIGAVDVEYNYVEIGWEAGSASGGSGGLGGYSARVGVASALIGTILTREEPGSGEQGKLLDSSTIGLVHRSQFGLPRGRLKYSLTGGWITSDSSGGSPFVALGDSFSSGEGVGDYFGDSNSVGVNECHRSRIAYSQLFSRSARLPSPDFRACSGAKFEHLYENRQWANEPVQVLRTDSSQLLGSATRNITLSIGGNDLGFVPVLLTCVLASGPVPVSCAIGNFLASSRLNSAASDYRLLWSRLVRDAPNARIFVLGYPKFFPSTPYYNCYGLNTLEQKWINDRIAALNSVIRSSIGGFPKIHYVDVENAFDGHHLCRVGWDNRPWMNGLTLPREHSFHPNADGHRSFASILFARWQNINAGWLDLSSSTIATSRNSMSPFSESMITLNSFDNKRSDDIYFRASFRNGENATNTEDIGSFDGIPAGVPSTLQLVAPSGQVFGLSSQVSNIRISIDSDSALFVVSQPELGEWTLQVADTPGIQASSEVIQEIPVTNSFNIDLDQSEVEAQVGQEVILSPQVLQSADSSWDYHWDAGDGSAESSGPTFSHRYTKPGTYSVTLIVTNPDRDTGIGRAIVRIGQGDRPQGIGPLDMYLPEIEYLPDTGLGQEIPILAMSLLALGVSVLLLRRRVHRLNLNS